MTERSVPAQRGPSGLRDAKPAHTVHGNVTRTEARMHDHSTVFGWLAYASATAGLVLVAPAVRGALPIDPLSIITVAVPLTVVFDHVERGLRRR